MDDHIRPMASQISNVKRFERPARPRVPIGDERGTSAQSQLFVLAASLALWVVIIATTRLLIG